MQTDSQLFNKNIQSIYDNRHHELNYDDLNSAGSVTDGEGESLGGYSSLGEGSKGSSRGSSLRSKEDLRMALIARRRRLAKMETSEEFDLSWRRKESGSLVSSLKDSLATMSTFNDSLNGSLVGRSFASSQGKSDSKEKGKKKKSKDKKKKSKKKSKSRDREGSRKRDKREKERQSSKHKNREGGQRPNAKSKGTEKKLYRNVDEEAVRKAMKRGARQRDSSDSEHRILDDSKREKDRDHRNNSSRQDLRNSHHHNMRRHDTNYDHAKRKGGRESSSSRRDSLGDNKMHAKSMINLGVSMKKLKGSLTNMSKSTRNMSLSTRDMSPIDNHASNSNNNARIRVSYACDETTGMCAFHPDVRLRKRSRIGGGWADVLKSCPKCRAEGGKRGGGKKRDSHNKTSGVDRSHRSDRKRHGGGRGMPRGGVGPESAQAAARGTTSRRPRKIEYSYESSSSSSSTSEALPVKKVQQQHPQHTHPQRARGGPSQRENNVGRPTRGMSQPPRRDVPRSASMRGTSQPPQRSKGVLLSRAQSMRAVGGGAGGGGKDPPERVRPRQQPISSSTPRSPTLNKGPNHAPPSRGMSQPPRRDAPRSPGVSAQRQRSASAQRKTIATSLDFDPFDPTKPSLQIQRNTGSRSNNADGSSGRSASHGPVVGESNSNNNLDFHRSGGSESDFALFRGKGGTAHNEEGMFGFFRNSLTQDDDDEKKKMNSEHQKKENAIDVSESSGQSVDRCALNGNSCKRKMARPFVAMSTIESPASSKPQNDSAEALKSTTKVKEKSVRLQEEDGAKKGDGALRPKPKRHAYILGDEGRRRDMIKDDDKDVALMRIASIQPDEMAWIRRTTGKWTYAQVKKVTSDSIIFLVDPNGSTKAYDVKYWVSHVRVMKTPENNAKAPGVDCNNTQVE